MASGILKKTSVFIAIILFAFNAAVLAQQPSGKVLLASLDNNTENKSEAVLVTKEPTAIFPDILSGNEEQSADYIEKFSKSRRDYLIRTYKRGKSFFKKASAILKKQQIPQELNVLLALESGFNANAVSHAGAVGYWQIMDETAKEYGLRIVQRSKKEKIKGKGKAVKLSADSIKKIRKLEAKDDRRNFIKSTLAAAKYLRDRSRNLNNDWLLVVASYNCGVGNVWDAMAKSGKENPTFWDIKSYLPAETRAYVMNFIALNVVFSNYEKFETNNLTFKPTQVKAEEISDVPAEAALISPEPASLQ